MKIRIFALAKELGLDSKELIQHCNDAGLSVKNSALASISPAERDLVLDHLKRLKSGTVAPTTEPEVDISAPVREDASGVTRQIRDLAGGGPLASKVEQRRAPRKEKAVEAKEEPLVAETQDATPLEESAPEEVVETSSEQQEESVETTPPEVEEVPSGMPQVVEAPSEIEVEPAIAEHVEPATPAEPPVASAEESDESESEPEPEPTEKQVDPGTPAMSRSDYIDPTGGSSTGSGMREMRPQGSMRHRQPRKDKKKGPALPALASTPNYKPPTPKKKEEGPVLKPDVALTGDVLKKNKLADILKKNRDDTRKKSEEESGDARRGKSGSRGLSLEEARKSRRSKRKRRGGDEDDHVIVKTNKRSRRNSPIERKTEAVVMSPMTVRSLSEAMGRPARDLITVMFKHGEMVTINDPLEDEMALEIAMELGVDLEIEHEADFEDTLMDRLDRRDEDFDVELVQRPPIITVLGHVDHGKTTLVDRIRTTNVVDSEAGGITQHIAAYQVAHNGSKLTFVDTPGHAAFGEMRARGANVTDMIVLVVAANDGVMPQTVECISHAKAAGVPIIVALNKCDLPDINEQKVLTDLSQHGILPSEWGGDVEVIRVSALTGTGVDDLLETLLLTAELQEYKTAEDIPAEGACLESFMDEGRGPIAWSIVRRGVLKIGDIVSCGQAYGRVRAMYDDKDQELTVAGPSTPVRIAGLSTVPNAGSRFFVMDDIDEAREIAETREDRGRAAVLATRGGPMSLETFFAHRDGSIQDLPLILKADTPGSIEAIRHELEKFEHDEVKLKILHEGVGGVNESDVYLAASSGAIIIAFHVIAEDRAEALASQEGVQIRRYKIIYNVTDDIRQAMEGMLKPERVEVQTGRALVLRTFSISRTGTVAGCRVLNGTIDRNNRVHVIRDQTILNNYGIASLKREKDDAKEVREGFECGIRLDGFNDVKEGDLLEAYRIEERKRSLDE
ncbi:translation initiation factor IF-2 [Thalassoglobus polymorphus]|uniref:translation initiation factor IF-2 n=1 Tax=Thalassoglobus polymorphus TaxID=2527994 RepID=UPI0011A6B0AC|nr:translation initiation factor IF-2 [Thalassoglobus polymorphus]